MFVVIFTLLSSSPPLVRVNDRIPALATNLDVRRPRFAQRTLPAPVPRVAPPRLADDAACYAAGRASFRLGRLIFCARSHNSILYRLFSRTKSSAHLGSYLHACACRALRSALTNYLFIPYFIRFRANSA